MLHKTVVLVNLQVLCPTPGAELEKIAGQLRNSFYAASLPWSEGNLGRVITKQEFSAFYGEYRVLRETFYAAIDPEEADRFKVVLTVIPFLAPGKYQFVYPENVLVNASRIMSVALEERFIRRICMLQEALEKEKRFYASLLSGLGKIIETGLYLNKSINPKLVSRMKNARKYLLCHSAKDIRGSASLREDIINTCGALL
jgi:hypothetical protein